MSCGEMMLALMQAAYEFNEVNWEYFILIGHESVPLTNLMYVEMFLSAFPKGTNFMNCWEVSGYDFFGQWEDNTYRLEDIVVDSFDGFLIEDIREKRHPPKDITFFKSIQLVVVSRDFVRFVNNVAVLLWT
jgi:hypothetical protein